MNKTLLITLDWALITVSFFNTIALLWLGLMVLLNAEKQRWGTWVGGVALVLGGLFFAGHSSIVGRVVGTFDAEMEFWWRIMWLPIVGIPYLWYLMMAWYTDVLRQKRHRIAFVVVTILGLTALILVTLTDALPSYGQVVLRIPGTIMSLGGVPVVGIVYPAYVVLCFLLALSALQRPETSGRFMGDIARSRARPWLIAASFVLLLMSVCFAGTLGWFLHIMNSPATIVSFAMLISLDLIIIGMVAIAIVLTGEAIVSYEVFAGKVLPRSGLRHHWRSSLIFASSYSILLAWSLEFEVPTIYIVLLITIIITLRYAVYNWRSYRERERMMDQLRPFVTSQRIYERLVKSAAPPDIDTSIPLRALCKDVLDTEVAYLAPLGPLAPLVGPSLMYTLDDNITHTAHLPSLTSLAAQFQSPQTICMPVEPAEYAGAVWAVPLWSERGLIGVLLLGPKQSGGLYTQEEVEIARATGERLIDTQASAEMARRLMTLQRQRLAESQVLDRRTRRVLHDDVLPGLHTAMLMLSTLEPNDTTTRAVDILTDTHRQIANLLHAMPATSAADVARLGLIGTLRQVIEKEFKNAFDEVVWRIEPQAEQAVRTIHALNAEVVFYAAREAIRNSARYGRGDDTSRTLILTVSVVWNDGLVLSIEDNGVGIGRPISNAQNPDPNGQLAQAQTQPSKKGSGHGLALHSTMMAVIGGTLTLDSTPERSTRVSLTLPDVGEVGG